MKILIVSPYLPHPLCGHGAGVFIYKFIHHISKKHRVTLVSFCDQSERILAEDLKQLPLELHLVPRVKGAQETFSLNFPLVLIRILQLIRSVILWQPYYVSKFRHPRMSRLVKRLTRDHGYDIVQFEFTQMGQYARYVQSGKILLHELDVSYRPSYRRYQSARSLLMKALTFIEWCRWARYEPKLARSVDRVLTVTDQDRLLLEWLTNSHNISYFPHAVDIPQQAPQYSQRESHSLLFVGSYSHSPNTDAAIWLCRDIFPLVQKIYPGSTLYIVGSNPPEGLREFGRLNAKIKIPGFVESVDEYLQRCAVFIAPLRIGGGVKNKILFAMAQSIPVVSTKVGIEGIDGIEPGAVLIGNSEQKLVDHIFHLFENPGLADETGKRGKEIVREWYSWEKVIADLEQIYEHCLM